MSSMSGRQMSIRIERIVRRLRAFCRTARREDGASLAEYAVLLGVLAIVLVGVISRFRISVGNSFTRTSSAMASVTGNAGGQSNADDDADDDDDDDDNDDDDDDDDRGRGRGRRD